MIIKSMSRKEPSFGQLTAYMSDEKSDRDFHLYRHVFQRDPSALAEEFEANARILAKRKNGNYLYHEILSLDTRRCGQGREVKEKLRLLALDYVERRCPENMVFGAMHQDHDGHLHYHLMISANQKDDRRRFRLPKARFDAIQRETERQALQDYPELKQECVIDKTNEERAKSRERRKSQKQLEMEKRGAKLTKKEQLAQDLRGMMAYAKSQAEFERLLQDRGYTLRQRGKNWVLDPVVCEDETKKPKSHRFSTLGVHAEYEAFLDRVEPVIEDGRGAGEKEKTDDVEYILHSDARESAREEPEQAAPERDGPESDNEIYVKYDSNTDLNRNTASQQNPEDSQERDPQGEALSDRQKDWKSQAEERRVKKKNRDRDGQEREQ